MSGPLPVVFTLQASRQAEEASRWWRQNRSKAPEAFVEELERSLSLIAAEPGVGARARDVRFAGVRRVLLHRVRYFVYYRVVDRPEAALQILAVWHASRGSAPPVAVAPN